MTTKGKKHRLAVTGSLVFLAFCLFLVPFVAVAGAAGQAPVSISPASSETETETVLVPSNGNATVNMTWVASEYMTIQLRVVEPTMRVGWILFTEQQHVAWLADPVTVTLTQSWIYANIDDRTRTRAEDRVYKVVSNGTYFIVFLNDNDTDLNVELTITNEPPFLIPGYEPAIIAAITAVSGIGMAMLVARRTKKGQQKHRQG